MKAYRQRKTSSPKCSTQYGLRDPRSQDVGTGYTMELPSNGRYWPETDLSESTRRGHSGNSITEVEQVEKSVVLDAGFVWHPTVEVLQ